MVLRGFVTRHTLIADTEAALRLQFPGTSISNQIDLLPRDRDDDRIRLRAKEALRNSAAIQAARTRSRLHIHIIVRNREITLFGTVETPLLAALAEQSCKSVRNVSAVVNSLCVAKQKDQGKLAD